MTRDGVQPRQQRTWYDWSVPGQLETIGWELEKAADPASHSRVTFAIEAYDTMVRLTVTHDDLEAGSDMAKTMKQGWPAVLSSLKSFLETGRGLDIFGKPKAA